MSELVIFTNRALARMKQVAVSEKIALEVLRKGKREQLGNFQTSHRKYGKNELGVLYLRDKTGKYKILSAWKRGNRRY